MSITNTTSFDELYSLVTIEWDNAMRGIELQARSAGIFNEMPFPDGTGKFRRVSEYDFEEYARNKSEGGQAAIQRQQLGYEKDMTLVRRALNVEFTYEGKHYEKYSFNTDAVQAARRSLEQRLDLDLQPTAGQNLADPLALTLGVDVQGRPPFHPDACVTRDQFARAEGQDRAI